MNLIKKVPKKIIEIIHIVVLLISSFFGMCIALRAAVREDLGVWRSDFFQKRILIVGTGPSIDAVDSKYFSQFDVLVCVNHAILCVSEHPCIYYFSTDVPRSIDVMNSNARENILAISRRRRILCLSFVLLSPHIVFGFLKNFIVVRYSGYRVNRWGGGRFKNRAYQPEQRDDEYIIAWLSGNGSIDGMPSRLGSSAFSAMVFAARFRPAEIRLIGVDLNDGRAHGVQHLAGPGGFAGKRSQIKKYKRLETLIRSCGIIVHNDSWSPMNDGAVKVDGNG